MNIQIASANPSDTTAIREAIARAAQHDATLAELVRIDATLYASAVPAITTDHLPPEVKLLTRFLPMRWALREYIESILSGEVPAPFADGDEFGRAWLIPLSHETAVRISTAVPRDTRLIQAGATAAQ